VIVGRGKLNDGAIFAMIWLVSVDGADWICSCGMTSTGTALSASAPIAREPTVISWPYDTCSTKSCVASPPLTSTVDVRDWNPSSAAVTRTVPPTASAVSE
jgi:hypothetical protein